MHQFHIVMNPFNKRSQMIAKCGKDKNVAHEVQSVSLMFWPHCDIFSDRLLYRPITTWNLFVSYD